MDDELDAGWGKKFAHIKIRTIINWGSGRGGRVPFPHNALKFVDYRVTPCINTGTFIH